MKVGGLDPGLNGAVASWDGELLAVFDIPKIKSKGRGEEVSEVELADIMQLMFADCDHFYIEKVASMPKQGVASTFKFGYSAGIPRGMIAMNGTPITMVTPSVWKTSMDLGTDKEYARTKALQTFPSFSDFFKRKKDHNRAEAALLALYGYEQLRRKGYE